MTTVAMIPPNTAGGVYEGMPSGTSYTLAGGVQFDAQPADVSAFLSLGFTLPTAPNTAEVGTAGVGVTAAEYGDAYRHITVLTIAGVLPAIAGGAALGVGLKIYTLPAGAQIIKSSKMDVAITQTEGNISADTPEVGLGTVVASGAVAVLSGTATFEDINTGTAAADCNGTPTEQAALATDTPFGLVTDVGGVKDIFFNVADTWAANGDAAALLTGTVTLEWTNLG